MIHQQRINEYLQETSHHGHTMHRFHATWHRQNPDPRRPQQPDRNWGSDNSFGQDFLQMHHEMVKAKDAEQKFFMHHQSLTEWYNTKGYDLPQEWDPLSIIPDNLNHLPNPDSVTLSNGQVISLYRGTNQPAFELPKWFTIEGVSETEEREPITGAKKLSDFINVNQLGCCIIFPHNIWHNRIGGSMLLTATAINDPIFYFGVHWYIDKVYDEYKALITQKDASLKSFERIKDFTLTEKYIEVPEEFTSTELEFLDSAQKAGDFARQEVNI